MDKREPSLVPEWLRTGSGGASSDSSHNSKTRSKCDVDSAKHAYTSFNYNSRERDPWDLLFIAKDQEQLSPSHSLTTRKHADHLPQRFTFGSQNGYIYNGQGTFPGISPAKSSKKSGFDKNFPFLRVEERNGSPSPGPNSPSVVVGVGEAWTSALAGFHANVTSLPTLKGPSSRNMAQALVQAPVGTGALPQGSVNTQRLEDREIKQSRQLIPLVPSAPKGTVLNSSDKSKARPGLRIGEGGLASSKNTQQQSSMLLGNLHFNPGSQIKPDTSKKLVVLKPARENVVAAGKESGIPSGKTDSQTAAPSTQVISSVRSTRGVRGASLNMVTGKTVTKKPSLAQTQSRNAFYSTLKQKTSTNFSTDASKTSSCIFSSVKEKASSFKELAASNPSNAQAAEKDDIKETVDKLSEVAERNSGFESADRPDEKEAEFLKSLGWDENSSEEGEAITEEEIRAFIEQCKKLKPSLVQRLPIIQEATKEATADL